MQLINKIKFLGEVKVLVIIIFSLFFPLASQAVGVSVNLSQIDILYPDQTAKEFNVKNISPEPIRVNISIDAQADKIIIEPEQFSLLPEEISQVKVMTDFPQRPKAGVLKTNLSVVSQALDKQSFNAASGIKIPLTIFVEYSFWQWTPVKVFVVTILSLLILFFFIKFIKYSLKS